MTSFSRRTLFWAPRALSIAFIGFLSLFALDVFGEGYGFWKTLLALAMHLIPSFVLIAALIVAWRWEWVGAALYAAAATFYVVTLWPRPNPPPAIKLGWCLTIAGPAFLIAALFLAGWLKRGAIRART
ncbi:MAG: hypothetical protein ABSC23_18070 [Bryobacteraceae bacterium]|jgi:hypothetical protein